MKFNLSRKIFILGLIILQFFRKKLLIVLVIKILEIVFLITHVKMIYILTSFKILNKIKSFKFVDDFINRITPLKKKRNPYI